MSSERFHKGKCIIKKLDFENCIVTNTKTKARGRKKLRARITRQVEDIPPDVAALASSQDFPVSVQMSPVLIGRPAGGRESPVLSKRKKVEFPAGEEEEGEADTTTEELPSPSSPVFKFLKRNKTLTESPSRCEHFKKAVKETETIEEGASCGWENSYQIEETTTQESKDSIRVSSVESTDAKDSNFGISSVDSTLRNSLTALDKCESPKPGKRNYKKNSLLGRLRKLQQKQASEKLLRQHQNRKNSAHSLRFSVLAFWKDDSNFCLKCKSSSDVPVVTFLLVDSRWVPALRKVKRASILQLHPPWQKITVEECNATVLVNVICLDVLEEEEEEAEEPVEAIPVGELERQEKLFVDSLFSSGACGFLC